MQFRHPELLYALFALVIPIIIHLFKLRKFKKVAFSNVALLEKVKLQSRKSAQLKKWLVLCSRLALLACIILAFCKPFLPASNTEIKPDHYIIYLDNSYSMQAQGSKGELLQRAIQDLIPILQEQNSFSLFTNNDSWENVNLTDIQNELLQIKYANEQLSPEQVALKFKKIKSDFENAALISISDFQDKNWNYKPLLNVSNGIIKLKALETNNIAIDSVWRNTDNENEINIALSNVGDQAQTTVSIFNKKELLGRSTVNFEKKNSIKSFMLPKNKAIEGQISIVDKGLSFDNQYFFSIQPLSLSRVISIGDHNQEFLSKIYTKDRFKFSSTSASNINFAELTKANTIILNEVEQIEKSLENLLVQFLKNDGTLVIIPPKNTTTSFLTSIKAISGIEMGTSIKEEQKITQINFSHPSFKGVFTKTVDNFQYPQTATYRKLKNVNWLLNYQNNEAFLGNRNKVFAFSSALSKESSNFLNSPLVVPTFFKLGLKASENKNISYTIGNANEYFIPLQLKEDQVIQLKSQNESFIPLQQTYSDYVKIMTSELPKNAGNYSIVTSKSNQKSNYSVSYNYNTSESNLNYISLPKSENTYSSIAEYFSQLKAGFQTTDLWKWFIIFAVIFLLIEILLLKFLK